MIKELHVVQGDRGCGKTRLILQMYASIPESRQMSAAAFDFSSPQRVQRINIVDRYRSGADYIRLDEPQYKMLGLGFDLKLENFQQEFRGKDVIVYLEVYDDGLGTPRVRESKTEIIRWMEHEAEAFFSYDLTRKDQQYLEMMDRHRKMSGG